MSAFVVDADCLYRCARGLCGEGNYGPLFPSFAGVAIDHPQAMHKVGQALLAMNVSAVRQRYPDRAKTIKEYPVPFWLRTHPPSLAGWCDSFKALQCLQYQCSEGNVPDTDLFKELDAAIGTVACYIVSMLPDYDAAPWG